MNGHACVSGSCVLPVREHNVCVGTSVAYMRTSVAYVRARACLALVGAPGPPGDGEFYPRAAVPEGA